MSFGLPDRLKITALCRTEKGKQESSKKSGAQKKATKKKRSGNKRSEAIHIKPTAKQTKQKTTAKAQTGGSRTKPNPTLLYYFTR
jgi:hypothetical protein